MGTDSSTAQDWADNLAGVDAVIFMVDTTAPERFEEARTALASLLSRDELQDLPLLVLGNRRDATAQPVTQLDFCSAFAMSEFPKSTLLYSICCVQTREGYDDAILDILGYLVC